MSEKHVVIPISENENVSGIISVPDGNAKDKAVIIAHGAGNDMNHSLLAFLATGLAKAGFLSLRFNFLYREMGKKGPNNERLLYVAWEGAYRFLSGHPQFAPKHIVAAGKSMGGRIASQMSADGLLDFERLILLGYPLHSPGKTERLQDAHLYKITVPMLFFEGSKDRLCDLQLLEDVRSKFVATSKLVVIEGGDHSFHVPKSFRKDPVEIYEMIAGETVKWLNEKI